MITMSKDAARIACSAALAVLGAAAFCGGLGYGLTNDDGTVGTGFLPAGAGAVIVVLALVDCVQSVLAGRHETPARQEGFDELLDQDGHEQLMAEAEADGNEDVDVLGRTASQRNRLLLMVLGIVLLSVLLVPLVGFLFSMAILLLAITIGVERMRPLTAVIVVVSALAVVWLVFGQLLSVPLPTGLLGII